jgi:hypothetical protein
MSGTVFTCCTDHRRAALQDTPALNGIDFLEVDDLLPAELPPDEAAEFAALPMALRGRLLWQRKLTVTFVNPLLPAHLAALTPTTLRIAGGERSDSRNISVSVLATAAQRITLRASARGDGSRYRLSVVGNADTGEPPAVFDPLLFVVDFSFRADCPSDFDCASPCDCADESAPAIDIDYVARDYQTFRRLMLDRIAVLSPEWHERHAADLGITLVELVAYVADYLAYRQDAIATEAYLGTARKRVSVRRHARLVDYPMHDGCNARTWVHIAADETVPATGLLIRRADPVTGVITRFLTRVSGAPVLTVAKGTEAIATQHPEVYEPLTDVTICPQHNTIRFYTWGATECCLPAGATKATLRGALDQLRVGDVVLFEEVRGPDTGNPADADPAHRVAVRLTAVRVTADPLGGRFQTPPVNAPVAVTQIEWGAADALRFPLCVSATVDDALGSRVTLDVSVARGNMVAVDHGGTVADVSFPAVPAPRLQRPAHDTCGCSEQVPESVPVRYRPRLAQRPVTCAEPFVVSGAASALFRRDVHAALPAVYLLSDGTADRWDVRRDLLRSSAAARDFVVEVETDGTASLRFGDGVNGLRPVTGTTFAAHYRVGNGTRGNVGADAIAHISLAVTAGIAFVRNPLPAIGGVDPETVDDVRRFAPVAFRTQERAVTTDDYAMMSERHPQVQDAAATFRWTGSWRTVFVTVDPFGSASRDVVLDPPLPAHLERYRMAGHDIAVDTPRYIPLQIVMQVCAKREYFRADVKRALLEVFSSRRRRDGSAGVFHPDNFTFGQPVYLSTLYAAAHAVDGVDSVRVTVFRRQGTPDPKPLADGVLTFGRLEIARLDNDPNYPDRGTFRLDVAGGK